MSAEKNTVGNAKHQGAVGKTLLARGPNSAIMAALLLSVLLSIATPRFLSIENIHVLSYGIADLALVAFAQMVVLAAGGMNASIGAIGGLVTVAVGGLMEGLGVPPVLAIIGGLLLGVGCGVLNGVLIVRMRLSPFIITLATASIFTGLNLGLTSGQPYYHLPDSFRSLGAWNVAGVPGLLFVTLLYAVALAFLFRSTGIGRQILAMGGNSRAAELAGVPIERCLIVVNALSGFLAASAAIILTARIGAAQPSVGEDWLLSSFAAPIIGGTSLAGGYLSVPGAFVGALLLTLVSNGLIHLQIDVFWTAFFSGLIILAAGGVDRIRALNSERLDREQRRHALARPVASLGQGTPTKA